MNNAAPTTDLNAVAAEICAMWHDYLQRLAKDDAGRAELVKMLEPQLRLFQNWPKDMAAPWFQAGFGAPDAAATAPTSTSQPSQPSAFQDKEQPINSGHDVQQPQSNGDDFQSDHRNPAAGNGRVETTRHPELSPTFSSPPATASDDGSLRVAQLALRVAALEERLNRLEARQNRRARKDSGAGED